MVPLYLVEQHLLIHIVTIAEWTQKILDNALELLSLDTELDDDTKELIKNAIPCLLVSPIL